MAEGDDYKYPLFGCFDDCTVCLLSYCCPCVAVGDIAESLGRNNCLHCCMDFIVIQLTGLLGHSCYVTYMAGQVREQRGIEGSVGKDCMQAFFCSWCFLTRISREIKEDNLGGQNMLRE